MAKILEIPKNKLLKTHYNNRLPNKTIRRKTPQMRINASQRNLLSIFLLCVLAFWGFGSIFTKLNLSISAEISTAAFGALFIILTTKFLMEQENDAERKQFVYQQNVSEYKEYAKLQLSVLEDGVITKEEINQIKMCHALLLVTGSDEAIKHSNDFLEKSIDASNESDGKFISDERRSELVKCTANFLLAARSGLYLPNDHIDSEKQIKLFLQSEEKARNAVRQATSIEENQFYQKLDGNGKKNTHAFLEKFADWGFDIKYTKTQISVYPKGEQRHGFVVCYVAPKNDSFLLNSPASMNEAALADISQKYPDLNARILGKVGKRNEGKTELLVSLEHSILDDEKKLENLRELLLSIRTIRSSEKKSSLQTNMF